MNHGSHEKKRATHYEKKVRFSRLRCRWSGRSNFFLVEPCDTVYEKKLSSIDVADSLEIFGISFWDGIFGLKLFVARTTLTIIPLEHRSASLAADSDDGEIGIFLDFARAGDTISCCILTICDENSWNSARIDERECWESRFDMGTFSVEYRL